MKTKWKNWLKAAGVRAVKTIAQTAVATIGTSAVLGDVDWIVVASASVLAACSRCSQALPACRSCPTRTATVSRIKGQSEKR